MILNEQQRMIRDTARALADRAMRPHVADWDRDGGAPRAIYRTLGQAGLMGVCTPLEWGGSGADLVSYVVAMEEIAAADCGIANGMAATNSPVGAAIVVEGTQAQKETWLPALASGAKLGSILLTEPHAGSEASAVRTRAEWRGERWILNGVKQFITNGRSADLAMIVAVSDPAAGKRGITCFLTPTSAPGYRVAREERKLGHRTCDTCQIVLEDLEISPEGVLGPPGEGLRIALANLSIGRIGVAAQAVGCAREAYEAALRYSRERETFGKPIFEHQAIGFMLAEMATDIEVARQMYLHAAELEMSGAPSITAASMAKLHASEMAERVCSRAIQIHGGYGYIADYPVEKIYRDQRVLQIYEGTSEVQKIVIARQLARV
jgi:alkylation response protein AidB-like acyl-CoA dehydrogenase